MQTNILERIRSLEADIEKDIDSIVQQELFASSITNDRHRILLDHFVLQHTSSIHATAEKLLDAYLDEDDIEEAQSAPSEGSDVIVAAMKSFEAKIADIREYHHTYRDLPPIQNGLDNVEPKLLDDIFAVNERYGECFDLNASYNNYSRFMVYTKALAEACSDDHSSLTESQQKELGTIATSSVAQWSRLWSGRLDFFHFTKTLPQLLLQEVEAHRKIVGFRHYQRFVMDLLAYLSDFYLRIYPLKRDALDRLLLSVESDGEIFWAALIAEKAAVQHDAAASSSPSFIPGEGSSVKAAEAEAGEGRGEVGDGIDANGHTGGTMRVALGNKLSCGLTVPPSLRRYVKSYSFWPIAMIEQLLSKEAALHPQGMTDADAAVHLLPCDMAEVKKICFAEAQAAALLQSLLFKTLAQTEAMQLRDYSKTVEELEMERWRRERDFMASIEEVMKHTTSTIDGTVARASAAAFDLRLAIDSSDDEADKAAEEANQKRSNTAGGETAAEQQEMLGEDGQPIPRWLVQLQQLDKTFVCDVCGGTVYRGPKVFREHFAAERHAEGLRRLGVTRNLKDFEGISSIREVIDMRDQLSKDELGFRKRLRENADNEEIQDVRGRVVTAKDYERLQQQRRY